MVVHCLRSALMKMAAADVAVLVLLLLCHRDPLSLLLFEDWSDVDNEVIVQLLVLLMMSVLMSSL